MIQILYIKVLADDFIQLSLCVQVQLIKNAISVLHNCSTNHLFTKFIPVLSAKTLQTQMKYNTQAIVFFLAVLLIVKRKTNTLP